jgi:hypothetical protein
MRPMMLETRQMELWWQPGRATQAPGQPKPQRMTLRVWFAHVTEYWPGIGRRPPPAARPEQVWLDFYGFRASTHRARSQSQSLSRFK